MTMACRGRHAFCARLVRPLSASTVRLDPSRSRASSAPQALRTTTRLRTPIARRVLPGASPTDLMPLASSVRLDSPVYDPSLTWRWHALIAKPGFTLTSQVQRSARTAPLDRFHKLEQQTAPSAHSALSLCRGLPSARTAQLALLTTTATQRRPACHVVVPGTKVTTVVALGPNLARSARALSAQQEDVALMTDQRLRASSVPPAGRLRFKRRQRLCPPVCRLAQRPNWLAIRTSKRSRFRRAVATPAVRCLTPATATSSC